MAGKISLFSFYLYPRSEKSAFNVAPSHFPFWLGVKKLLQLPLINFFPLIYPHFSATASIFIFLLPARFIYFPPKDLCFWVMARLSLKLRKRESFLVYRDFLLIFLIFRAHFPGFSVC